MAMNIWQIGRAALQSLQSLHAAPRKSFPAKSRRLLLEPLEHRALLSVTVNSITGPQTGGVYDVPSGKDLYVPVTGTDAGQTINYTASSNTAGVTATVLTGNSELDLTVSGTTAGGTAFSGTMVFELFANIAPTTVSSIITDVEDGLYNGAEFYRSETSATFQLIQGGIQPPSGTISGKTVPATLPDEFNSAATFNSPGMLAMANAGANTATSEFFVTAPNTTLADEPQSLDYGYTIFGQILSGFDIYNDVLNVPTTQNSSGIDYDNTPVTITSASIVSTNLQDAVVQISEASTFSGTAQITVTGTGSSDGTSASQSFSVVAAPPVAQQTASPVFLAPISNQTTTAGKAITFQISATDQDSGTAAITVGGTGVFSAATPAALPSGVTVSYAAGSTANTEEVTLTPATGFTGTLNLVAHADDTTNSEHDALPFTLTVNPALSITTTTVPNWTVDRPSYSTTLAATGGTGTDTFALASGSSLPAGLTLSTTGVISGEPTTAGTTSFTVTATDQSGATASQTYSITINNALSITSTVLPSVTVGTAYNATIETSGGTSPIAFALASGSSLPAGLALSTSGVISGTPTANGSGSVTVTATDAAGSTATQTLTYVVSITLSPTTLPNWTQNSSYSQTLTASGGTGSYTYSETSGTLPAGLTLSSAGLLSGTPATAGTSTFTIQAKDGSGNTGTQQYTVTINPQLSIATTTLSAATVNSSYSATIQSSGGTGADTFAVTSGSLPAGLSLSSSGAITGTPTTAGSANITVTATDAVGAKASQSLTLTVNLEISPSTLSAWTVNTAGYSQTLTTTGGTGTNTFALESGGSLPAGLTLSAAGVISGTPTAAGTTTFTVKVTDSGGNTGSQQYTLTINPALSITATALPAATVGTAYDATVPTSGGTGADTFEITSGTLPAGLTLDASGTITGTPTTATTGPINVTILVTDSIGDSASQVVAVAANLGITPTTLPNWTIDQAGYNQQLTGSGGSGTYTFSVPSSTLPTGLTLNSAGLLSGTPTATGTFRFTVTTTDSAGHTGSQAYSVTINPAVTIGTTSLPSWTSGQAGYSQTILVSGGTGADTFTVTSGSLPSGLSLNNSTGVISGTPAAAGSSNFTVTATDTVGATASKAYSLTINSALSITTTTLSSGTKGAAYNATIVASGGTGADTFAVTSGTLPTGLSLNSGTGVISGTPTVASNGAGSITVTATDSVGATATQTYSFSINQPITLTPTTTALPSSYINESYNQTITASGGTGTITFAVTSGSLPAGVTLTSGGVLSGTPTASGSFDFTVTATDAAEATAAQAYTLTINPFALTPTTLPNWTANLAGYSQTIIANGNNGAATFSISSGSLPTGLSLNSSTGVISGTPTAANSYSFTVEATDSKGATATESYSVTINAALSITPTTLPGLSLATPVNTTITTSGGTGADTFSVTSGTLPAGLSLNSTTGAITGTPTSASSFNFTVTATDSAGATKAQAYSGSVTRLGLSGTVYDDVNGTGKLASGDPGVAGVTIVLSGTGSSGNSLPSQTTTTASDGTYSFTGIPAGTYSLYMDEPSKLVGGGSGTISNLTVAAGSSGTNNNFIAGSATSSGPITINSFLASSPTEAQAIAKAVGASTTTPVVTSITLANANPTSAASVSYDVDFNQNVTGVDMADFAINPSSGITGESITSVTGSGSSYTVVVNTGSGAGTLALNVLQTNTIVNASGTALGGPGSDVYNFTGPSYNIQKIAVSVTTVPTSINLGNEDSTTVSGTGEAGATVSVVASDSAGDKTTAQTATVSSSGTWSISGINVSSLKDGTITYTATATDSQNGTATSTMTATKATVAPTVAITTVTSPINLSNQADTSVSGTGSDGDTVSVVATDGTNKTTAQTATVSSSGAWSISGINVTTLNDGTITYTATITDSSGNTATSTLTATKNTTTPALALTSVTTPITFSNEKATVASGTAEDGATVSVVATDGTTSTAPQELTVGSSGTWSISGIDVSDLKDGTITYTATATDPTTGNTATSSITTTKDTVVPTVTISSATNPISAANVGNVSLSGTVTVGDTVSVTATDGAATPNTVTQAANVSGGSWSISGFNLSSLEDGTLTFTVTAKDPSDNTATATQTATKDTVVPTVTIASLGAINTSNAGSLALSGTVTAGSTVAVVASDGVNSTSEQTATVVGGTWSIPAFNVSTLNDGTITFTVTATDSAGINTSQSSTTAIKNTLSLTTTSPLPTGANGVSYTATIATSGGSGGNTFAVTSGSLPAGLSLTASGADAGQITGIVTAASNSTSTFTITATDSVGGTASQSYSITIDSFAITPSTLPAWTLNQPGYSRTLTASSGTPTFSVSQGSLPTGLALSGGVISGTPTVAGTYSFTVTATETGLSPVTQDYTLVINPAVSISPTTLPSWTTGQSGYSQTLTASGGTGNVTFALASGSTLPAGLALNATGTDTATISGTPTASGTFTIMATDSTGASASQTYTFTVNPALSLATATLPATTNGVSYSTTLSASGGTNPDSFAVTSGALPKGLSIDSSTGQISGTTAVTTPGAFPFTVTVSDASGAKASQSYSITVNAAIALSPATLTFPVVNASYDETITATGGTGNVTLSVPSADLPTGLTFASTPGNPATGTISGTPTADGSFTFTVTATDTVGATMSQTYTVTVAPFTLSPTTLPAWTSGLANYSQTITATGGTPTFSISAGALPTGLTLNPNSGIISGKPTTAGTYDFTVTAEEAGVGSVSQAYSIQINAALGITPTTLPAPTLDTAYPSTTLTSSGGTGTVTLSVPASDLPTGLTFTSSPGNPGTGTISGTPTASGTFTFTVTATDADGATATQSYTLTVNPVVAVTQVTSPINLSNDTATSVSGTGEPLDGISVTASDAAGDTTSSYPTTVGSNGQWTITGIDVSTLDDGTITYTAVITGGSGLTAQASLTATKSTVDITSVTNPITTSNDTSTTVGGTCDTNVTSITVTATDGNTTTAPQTATITSGTWTVTGIDVSGLNDGTITYTAKATDANSDVATSTSTAQKSTVAITSVTTPISLSNETTTSVSGTGVPNATLEVTASDGTHTTTAAPGTVLANGQWTVSSINVSNLSDGTITYLVRVTNPNGTTGNASITTTKETVAPQVGSVVLADASPVTAGATVAFTVTFNQSVTGVDSSAFQLAPSSGVIASISSVTGSGNTYTVTVNTNGSSTTGTLGLNVVADSNVADQAGFTLGSGYTGPTYTVEAISPGVTASDLTDAALASETSWT
jgi:cyclophilin family peptidyl-prolyl cis-trans isomerase